VLIAGYVANGVLNTANVTLSIMMLVPVIIGMGIGTFIQDRLDQARFKKLVLIVLCLLGLNLLRRGFYG
ncbi:MAG: sulfite exporter TauE/SafE family protein, partial [Pseudomonadota bacterium]